MTGRIGLAFFSASLLVGCGASHTSTIEGMTDAHYSKCIELGSAVMSTMSEDGLDSPEHKDAYDQWNLKCSLAALFDLTLKNSDIPKSPKAWADLQ